MKLNKQAIIIAVSVGLLIAVTFQNCSQATSRFGIASSSTAIGDEIKPTEPVVTPTPEVLRHVEESTSPKLQFYSVQNGQAVPDLYLGEVVHGVVSNVDSENAWGCATYLDRQSECDDPAIWAKLPVPGWRYVPETRSWMMSENLDQLFVANREFVMFFHDRKNDIRIQGTNVMKPSKAVAPSCQWTAFVIGPSNPAKPTKACTAANAWEVAPASSIDWTCYCPGIPNPNEKPTVIGYISNITISTKAFSYYELLTGNSSYQPPAMGGECVVGRVDEGRLADCDLEWQGENPNKYKMCKIWISECSAR